MKSVFVHFFLGMVMLLAITGMSSCEKSVESRDNAVNEEGLSGSITRFAVLGNYLYGLNSNGILTYDVSNPSAPVLTNTLTTDYGLETITIYDGFVYVGSRQFLYILNISNPAQPVLLSKTEGGAILGGGCDPVVVKGNYAYSTIKTIENICGNISANSALLVYNVANKSNPNLIDSQPLDMPNGLGYKGNYLMVCDEGVDKVLIFNIANPAQVQPTSYSIAMIDPVDLIVNGNRMIVSTKTNFNIYDISNIADIKKLASVSK